MSESHGELPNLVTILAQKFHGSIFSEYLHLWENVIFSVIVGLILSLVAYFATRKASLIPGRLQGFLEIVVSALDDFVCGILGHKGRRFTPFIGTLFLYILLMNLSGMVPFMKSSTSSLSTTVALALCVFVYLQYTALKENGIRGYIDHMMGNPRGVIAFSVVIPLLISVVHVVSELVRPLSLALRLRSNVWAEDALLSVAAGFGIAGVPLFVFSMFLMILSSIIQALVFSLLSAIYFALVLPHEEH
jgi:F-type H+-transporting ATPase subunit a